MLSVLFVDDDPEILNAYRRVYFGRMEVATATEGQEALRMMAERPFDVVVADLLMPGMDGLILLSRTREALPGAGRILLTAYVQARDGDAAVRSGLAHKVMTKPCLPDSLEAAIVECGRIAGQGSRVG